MSISKLRSRRAVLSRQEHVKSPNEIDVGGAEGEGSSPNISAGCQRVSVINNTGGSCANSTTTMTAASTTPTTYVDELEEMHKTAKQTASTANATKLLNAAAFNAAVVAAATVATVTAKQQEKQQQQQIPLPPSHAQTNLPQTSLLKIEPFVPSLTTRLRRRPFGRSYTTLTKNTTNATKTTTKNANNNTERKTKQNNSTNILNSPLLGAAIDSNLAKANAASTRAAVAARLRRNPVRATVKRQRSKSTSSSASNRPNGTHRNLSPNMPLNGRAHAAAVAMGGANDGGGGDCSSTNGNSNGSGYTAIVTLQPNGICRIIRSAEEREKQPDRINYDRRGLSAIPIFEHETQLRLLSLQHNLINIFHIPKDEQRTEPQPTQPPTVPEKLAAATQAAEIRRTPDMQSELAVGSELSTPILINNLGTKQKTRHQNERVAVERINGPVAGAGVSANTACTSASGGFGIGAGVRLSLALGTTTARQLHNNALMLAPPTPPPTPLGQLQSPGHHPPPPPPPHVYQQLLQQRLTSAAALNSNTAAKNLHYNAPLLPLPRQPTPSRFALKRSKSFLTNIPRHLHHIQQHMLKTQMVRARLPATGVEVTTLKSFDSNASALSNNTDSTSSTVATTIATIDSDKTYSTTNGTTFAGSDYDGACDPLAQLAVKNRQLVASYGALFRHLVFLDLYDNQIERIGNLDGLPALSVLLLGKNRISDISGLHSLKQTLRVLDLHGNKITHIAQKLNCLRELKSLNLAGNLLRQIGANDFSGLQQLSELNLKRNKIKRINGFHHLTALERLWLCHNELHRVEDMASVAKAINLLEITIDNNPVSLAGDCVSFLVSYLPRLQTLSQMPITEQVREAAMSWRRNKEISETHYAQLTPDAYQSIKREEVISSARTNWELLRSQQMSKQHTPPKPQQQLPQQTPRIAKPTKELSRINESNEMADEVVSSQDQIKLPPIKQHQEEEEVREGQCKKEESVSPQGQRMDLQRIHKPQSATQAGQIAPSTKSNTVIKEMPTKGVTETTKIVKPPQNVNNADITENSNNSARLTGSPGSSLGPNVHSSSSCFSSDNSDDYNTDLRLQQRATRSHKYQKKASKEQEERQRRGVEEYKAQKTTIVTSKRTSESRKTIEACDKETSALATGAADAHQVPNQANKPRTAGPALDTNAITTKQTTNVANATNHATPEASTEDGASQASHSATKPREPQSQVVDRNSSSILMTNPRTTNANKTTIMSQQKLTANATTPTPTPTSSSLIGSTATLSAGQPTNQSQSTGGSSSNSSSILSLLSPTLQLPPQHHQQQKTKNYVGGSNLSAGLVGANTRTVCRRLMRSQTVVSANNNSTPAANAVSAAQATNSGNEACNGNGRRTINHNQSKAPMTPCNDGQSVATQPTITCIVAPTPLSNNSSNTAAASSPSTSSSSLLGAYPRTTIGTASSKTEREAREREKEKEREREREQGGDYLIEICGRYLNVYGQGALRYIDKQWNAAKAHDVHTLNFSYINFNNIAATVLARIKARFPNAENFVFRETNIEFIGQLNALGELQGITTLTIDPEGNAITTKDLWREYAIFRLSHWGLKLINGVAVTEADIEVANEMFEGLADLVLWAMPATMLQPLLARLRLDETCTASKMSPKEWLMKPENKSLRLVVGKEALQWKKPTTTTTTTGTTTTTNQGNNSHNNNISSNHLQPMPYAVGGASSTHNTNINPNTLSMRERGRLHFATMLENTLNAVEKMHMLETLWPSMLLDIIRNALLDYSHLDEYLSGVMEEIMK